MKNVILNNHLKNFSLKYHYENKSESEQFEYPIKILKCFKFVEKHINDYKQWLESEVRE